MMANVFGNRISLFQRIAASSPMIVLLRSELKADLYFCGFHASDESFFTWSITSHSPVDGFLRWMGIQSF